MPADGSGLGLLIVALFAAMVGSFLNVVIYRLPRGLSVSQPIWSFCPACRTRIAPWWNIPIIGWLVLRGRCAACGSRIPVIYPAIEAMNVLAWVMIWDAWEVSRMAPGASGLATDWPLIAATCILFSGFLALSAMDIESYSIHIQVPLLCTAVGILAHSIRGWPAAVEIKSGAFGSGALPPSICLIVSAMGAVWLAMQGFIFFFRRPIDQQGPEASGGDESDDEETRRSRFGLESSEGPGSDGASWGVEALVIVALCGLIFALGMWITWRPWMFEGLIVSPGGQRAVLATLVLFFILVLASLTPREADQEIVDEIERERHQARATALRELAGFVPAILVGVVLLAVLRSRSCMDATWANSLRFAGDSEAVRLRLIGAGQAITGALLGAAMGWLVRILGTLAFGKEAFGTGDIYIMAAMGAVLGLWNVVIAFFLAAMLALVGVLATMFRKMSRAVPFGPWLALGSFGALWLERPLASFFRPVASIVWAIISGAPARY